MGVIFFNAFPGISHVSQTGLKKLFTINFDGSKIDSEESNLGYFHMGFFFKAFPDISHISENGLKKLFYNNRMSTYTELNGNSKSE